MITRPDVRARTRWTLRAALTLALAVAATCFGLPGVRGVRHAAADSAVLVSIGSASVAEGDALPARVLQFPVTLSAASTTAITVGYATAGITAESGVDFKSKVGKLTFKPSPKTLLTPVSKVISITVNPNTTVDGNRTFQVTLSNLTGAAALGDATATGTIIDDDPPAATPSISVGSTSIAEGNSVSTRKADVQVTLSAPAASTVTAQYNVSGLSATNNVDFKPHNTAKVTFKPGKVHAAIVVNVYPDATREPDEQISVDLISVSGAPIANGHGVVTIMDDDGPAVAAPPPMQTASCGTWALEQVGSIAELQSDQPRIDNALSMHGVAGLSIRVPWSSIDTKFDLLDDAYQIAQAHGEGLTVRFMAGRWTPASVFTAGSNYYTLAGGAKVPLPFMSDGTPNVAFENAYSSIVSRLAVWARAHGVTLLHLPWYGQDYSELNAGLPVRQARGYSDQAFLTGHERLVNIGLAQAGNGLSVEFPLSGLGPLTTDSPALADYIQSRAGAWSPNVAIQANGWGPTLKGVGDWGATGPDIEDQMDAVWTRSVRRGQQAIQPSDYDWGLMYHEAEANGSDYVEVYTASFALSQRADLATAVSQFASTCSS